MLAPLPKGSREMTERHFRVDDHANLTDQPDQSVQNSSQVPEDHADVVTATAEHGKKRVAPWVPFRVLRLSRPSFFMCPIIGSIALRRRRSLAIVPVTPRFAPLMKTTHTSTPWPRYPRSTKAIPGRWSVRVSTCSSASASVWPS